MPKEQYMITMTIAILFYYGTGHSFTQNMNWKNIIEPLEMFRHNMFSKKWIFQEVPGNTCLAFPYENFAAETK